MRSHPYSSTMLRVFCEVPITSSTVRLGFVLVVTDDLYTFCSLHLSLIISPFLPATRKISSSSNQHAPSQCSQQLSQLLSRYSTRLYHSDMGDTTVANGVAQGVVLHSQRDFFRSWAGSSQRDRVRKRGTDGAVGKGPRRLDSDSLRGES